MATFTRPDIFSIDLCNKVHDLDSDTYKWLLSNTAPVAGSTFTAANVTQISTGGGYTQFATGSNGIATTMTALSRSTAQTTVATGGFVFTATGAVGPFQYIILVNATNSGASYPVVGWINHGSAITMAITDTYTMPSGAILTVG
jgi:hypothetical protein